MPRLIFGLSLVVLLVCPAGVAMAQHACVLAPDGEVVCGPLVQPGYAPPPVPYYEPRPDFEGRRDERDRRRDPPPCPRGYSVQDGECKPYSGR